MTRTRTSAPAPEFDVVHRYRGRPLHERLVEETSVLAALRRHARGRPEQPVLTEFHRGRAGRTVSYRELAQRVAAAAYRLRTVGDVTSGDRVAIRMRNTLDSVVGLLAVLAARATVVVLSPDDPQKRVREQFDRARCSKTR